MDNSMLAGLTYPESVERLSYEVDWLKENEIGFGRQWLWRCEKDLLTQWNPKLWPPFLLFVLWADIQN